MGGAVTALSCSFTCAYLAESRQLQSVYEVYET